MIKYSIFYLLMCFIPKNHPFHVSILEININKENQLVEISQRVFIDDLELALKNYSQKQVSVINVLNNTKLDSLLSSYLKNNLIFRSNKDLNYNYLGAEIEEESLWIYAEISYSSELDKLTVINRILLDEFDDQQNLVHLTIDGKIKSASLYNDNSEKTFYLK